MWLVKNKRFCCCCWSSCCCCFVFSFSSFFLFVLFCFVFVFYVLLRFVFIFLFFIFFSFCFVIFSDSFCSFVSLFSFTADHNYWKKKKKKEFSFWVCVMNRHYICYTMLYTSWFSPVRGYLFYSQKGFESCYIVFSSFTLMITRSWLWYRLNKKKKKRLKS